VGSGSDTLPVDRVSLGCHLRWEVEPCSKSS
jgi:hypothetical protein